MTKQTIMTKQTQYINYSIIVKKKLTL